MAQQTCKCGAVYEVTYHHTPIPDTDYEDCSHCGERLASWRNETTWPEYKLVKTPDE
ncbi:hypothetical protein [Bradyrhizobium cosmicum]|uniref:hypothetical protein n=1 Tax=Bradyrhizobium cosmicum TaxID=1404864 RepID=UPI0028EA5375|nr:hypothetical protein [Bradyrhizobium cosmicum]